MNAPRTRLAPQELCGLALLVLSSLWLHLSHLGWALPAWERSLLAFETRENIQAMAPLLTRLREQVYTEVHDVIIDTLAGQPDAGDRINRTLIHNGLRAQLMQPRTTDEEQIIAALSRWKPETFWKLPIVLYGYAYIGLVAAALVLSHLFGYLRLTSDLTFYFLHPEQVARIYIAARWVGALSDLATIAILYRIGRKFFDWRTGFLAALLYSWNPLALVNSQYIKPWSFATLCACALLYFCLRIAQGDGTRRDYLLVGLFSGLLGGTTYIYLAAWGWIPCAAGFAAWNGRAPAPWRLQLQSLLAAIGVFFLTNLHVVTHFADFARFSRHYEMIGPHPAVLLGALAQGFLTIPGAFFIPNLASSCLRSYRTPRSLESFLLALLFGSLVFFGLVAGHAIHHLLPLYPALFLLVARDVVQNSSRRAWRIIFFSLAASALLLSLCASWTWLRDSEVDNLNLTGAWIVKHVPPGSSISIPDRVPGATSPPFPPLKYRLYHHAQPPAHRIPDTEFVIDVAFVSPGISQYPDFKKKYALRYHSPGRLWSYPDFPIPMEKLAPQPSAEITVWERRRNSQK